MIYLPLFVLVIASLALYMAWQDSKNNMERSVMVIIFLLVVGISLQSLCNKNSLLEGFEVEIPNVDEIETSTEQQNKNTKNNVSFNTIDEVLEYDETDTINVLKNKKPTQTNNKPNEKFDDIVQQDTHGKHNSIFNPQIVINAPQDNVETGENLLNNLMKTNENDYTTQFRNNMNTQNNNKMANTFENIRRHNKTIDEYLKPKPELFQDNNSSGMNSANNSNSNNTNNSNSNSENNSNSNSVNNSNSGMNSTSNNSNNANNSNSNSDNSSGMNSNDNSIIYPFVEDKYSTQNSGGFDPKTLTNRTFIPGMQYVAPVNWSVPQYHPNACRNVCPTRVINTRELPIGVMDYGTPINALELNNNGTIANNEDEVHLTNVGSMLPKFVYREYIECPANNYQGSIPKDIATTQQNIN